MKTRMSRPRYLELVRRHRLRPLPTERDHDVAVQVPRPSTKSTRGRRNRCDGHGRARTVESRAG
jgi:hypothetical protein